MTRFLSLVILLLHLLSDLRRRITLSATAAAFVPLAMLVIVGTVTTGLTTADSAPTSQTALQPVKIAQPVSHVPLATLQPGYRNLSPDKKAPSSPGASKPESIPPQTQAAGVTDTNKSDSAASGSQAPPSASIVLPAAQAACVSTQWAMEITSAQLSLGQAFSSDTAVSWLWETRIDSGDSSAQPPIPHGQNSQTVAAGQVSMPFESGTSSNVPQLLTAPEDTTYAYSVRLHVTAPLDATSDWISIPQATGACSS